MNLNKNKDSNREISSDIMKLGLRKYMQFTMSFQSRAMEY